MEVVEEEIEVLTSIFQADLKRLGLVWGFPKISLVVKPHMSQGRDPVEAEIEVTYCAGYPAKVPGVKIVRWQGISEENAKRLQQELQKECSRLASPTAEPFVFDLTRVVQDFLVQFRVVTKSFYEEFQEEETNRNRQVLEQKKKLQEQEALRNASLHARVNQALVAPVSPAIKPQAWDINFVSRRSYGEDRLLDEAEPDLDGLLKASAISKSRYLNDFEEIKMLGFGGFGKVVKARNRLDGRLYAVKRIKLEKQDANSNRKILREVTSLAKMFHQNIVRYYQAWIEDADGNISDSDAEDSEEDDDWGGYSSSSAGESSSLGNSPKSKHRALLSELDTAGLYQDDNFVGFGDWSDDGSDSADEVQEAVSSSRQTTESPSKVPSSRGRVLYIQMEYCPGETLREVIDKGLLVENPDLVWKFFRQIIEALWYIHDTCHFIHRDLKPANVFLDENGNVKLGDFGLAVTVQKGAEAKGTGVVEGVPNPTNSNSSRTNNTNYNSTTTTSPAGKKASNDVSSNHEQATSTTKKTKNRKKNKKTNASKTPLATTQSPTTSTTRRSKAPSVENTSGVGTTLYRAPEVLKGKYDEKCDMWSLGIMLYEMLVPPFETGMERIRTLTELRETGKATSGNLKKEARDLVEMLLQKKPKNRPSALSILESGRLPQKIETEKKYFDEVMRIVKGSNRSLPLYTRLMETLFSQVTRDEIFYTYDADILKYTNSTLGTLDPFSESKGQLRHQEILHAMQKLIYREMEKQFEIFGASPFYAPLLTPKTDIETDRQNLFCQLMDPQGTVVLLPMNLTRPFARWVALRQLSWMKRFDCSRVYVAAEIGNNLLGGQPRSKLQGSLDVIVPMSLVQNDPQFSHAWHADAIRCSVQALVRCSKSSTATDVTVFIHDAKLQDALLKSLDLGERSESIQLCSFLDALFSNEKISWVQVRKRCLEKLSQKQTDSLRALFANRQDNHKLVDIYAQRAQQESAVDLTPRVALLKHLLTCSDINCVFRPWLAPIPDMNSGLFYAIVMKRPIQKGSVGSSTAQGGSSSQTNSHPRKRRNHSQNSGTTTRKSTTTSSSGQHSHVPQTVCTLFQDSHVFVAATGGRYDSLIRQYQLTSVPRTQVAALGTRFHVERIAMQLIDPVVDLTPYTTLVLVASPCDEEPTCLLECAQLADQLRSHAIPADWMHPFPTSPAQSPISETFLNYCRSNRIPFFVNKRRGQVFRIRVVTNTGIDKDFPKLDQLINFIKSKIPELLNAKE